MPDPTPAETQLQDFPRRPPKFKDPLDLSALSWVGLSVTGVICSVLIFGFGR